MSATRIGRLCLALIATAAIWMIAPPAQAQLLGGCTCPAGYTPISGTTCTKIGSFFITAPAICPFNNVGHIVASTQQQSFWGINQILQQRRDRIQGTSTSGGTHSTITGYAPSGFDPEANTLSYSAQSQKNNPLAGLYDRAAAAAPAPAEPAWGTWLQGLGDTEHDGILGATDIGHVTNTYAVQGGLDRTQQHVLSADDAVVLGLVSSWIHAHTGYDGSATTMTLDGPGAGIYLQYIKGGFSTDLTTKFDFLSMNQNFAGAVPNASVDILNAGLSGNVQYKFSGLFGSDSNFIEPTAGFTLTHTGFGSGAAALGLEDAYTVRLQSGIRVGTTWNAGGGVSVDASMRALVYGDAVAQGTSVATNGSAGFITPTISPSDTGLLRGQLDPELSFNLPNDYSVTVSGQVRGGHEILGESVSVNLRKQF
jgi:hypothetical protein